MCKTPIIKKQQKTQVASRVAVAPIIKSMTFSVKIMPQIIWAAALMMPIKKTISVTVSTKNRLKMIDFSIFLLIKVPLLTEWHSPITAIVRK